MGVCVTKKITRFKHNYSQRNNVRFYYDKQLPVFYKMKGDILLGTSLAEFIRNIDPDDKDSLTLVAKVNVILNEKKEEMKGYQQSGFSINEDLRGNYIPKVQVSMVKEIYVSNTAYSCSEAVAFRIKSRCF